MLKLFLIILQISIILVLSLIIINNSFIVSFEINELIYSISSVYLLIFLIIVFFVIFLIQNFYFRTKFKVSQFKLNKLLRNKEKGYNSFVDGMIALANKDYKKATVESRKVFNYLSDDPSLSLLLRSEIFKIEKKFDELNVVYEQMIKNKSTENLGYKGMMEQYLNMQDYHHAFIYGEKLFRNNPFIEKIYDALVKIISKTNNWQQLIALTDKAYSKRIIDKNIFQENKSIAFFEIAKIKQFSDIKDSINCLDKALSLRKYFPPYVKFYLELLIQNKNYNTAKKFLRKAWAINPHPEYKSVITSLSNNLQTKIIDLANFITSRNSKHYESIVLIVEAAIASKKWDLARNHIKELLDIQPKKEVCLLMAKIEEGESDNMQKKNSWIARSKNGVDSNIWVCIISNKTQNEWSSVSDAGHFNSLEWKQPFMLNQLNSSNNSLFYENK